MSGTVTGTPMPLADLARLLASIMGAPTSAGRGLVIQDGIVSAVFGVAAETVAEGDDTRFTAFDTVTITTDTTLTAATHGGRMLKCVNPVVLTAIPAGIADGFSCAIMNLSGGEVVVTGALHPLNHTRLANDGIGMVMAGSRDSSLFIRWAGSVTQ